MTQLCSSPARRVGVVTSRRSIVWHDQRRQSFRATTRRGRLSSNATERICLSGNLGRRLGPQVWRRPLDHRGEICRQKIAVKISRLVGPDPRSRLHRRNPKSPYGHVRLPLKQNSRKPPVRTPRRVGTTAGSAPSALTVWA